MTVNETTLTGLHFGLSNSCNCSLCCGIYYWSVPISREDLRCPLAIPMYRWSIDIHAWGVSGNQAEYACLHRIPAKYWMEYEL